jgi:hypothetical protein
LVPTNPNTVHISLFLFPTPTKAVFPIKVSRFDRKDIFLTWSLVPYAPVKPFYGSRNRPHKTPPTGGISVDRIVNEREGRSQETRTRHRAEERIGQRRGSVDFASPVESNRRAVLHSSEANPLIRAETSSRLCANVQIAVAGAVPAAAVVGAAGVRARGPCPVPAAPAPPQPGELPVCLRCFAGGGGWWLCKRPKLFYP